VDGRFLKWNCMIRYISEWRFSNC